MTRRPPFEVADVVCQFGASFLATHGPTLLPEHRRVLGDILRCRTAALGGHVESCSDCLYQRIAYNSCRNRHCPKCQSLKGSQWVEAHGADLLPVPYFHVVFTIPAEAARIALQNKRVLYGILFATASETLATIAADPKHLGARIGALAVLHTWGQNLSHHPHIHMIVPGGGLSPDRSRWIPSRSNFFLSVKVLSRLFRRLFLASLKAAFRRGTLDFHGQLSHLANPEVFARLVADMRKLQWVVYTKKPFGGPDKVLAYLGRYTHRVAISNHRIIDVDDRTVTFLWRDNRDGGRQKPMTLGAHEFLRRFLFHTLPSGFHRIRSFGFLANARRADNLFLIRRLLHVTAPPARLHDVLPAPAGSTDPLTRDSPDRCPICKIGRIRIVDRIPTPLRFRMSPPPAVQSPQLLDSS